MNFKYFSKTRSNKEELKKIAEKNAQVFMNKQFTQLVDKQLSLPITLFTL